MLVVKSLSKSFGDHNVLKDVNFSIAPGTTTTLTGTNGAGKTVLFNIINGFLPSDRGKIIFKGKDLAGVPVFKRSLMGVGRIFQDLRLATNLTVLENLLLAFKYPPGEKWYSPIINLSRRKKYEEKLLSRSYGILKTTHLDEASDQLAGNLSYGQQKLLTIACLLANDSELLLMDEPFAGINPIYQEKLVDLFLNLKKSGKTLLIIEHNPEFIQSISERVLFLSKGTINEFDSYSAFRSNDLVKEAYV